MEAETTAVETGEAFTTWDNGGDDFVDGAWLVYSIVLTGIVLAFLLVDLVPRKKKFRLQRNGKWLAGGITVDPSAITAPDNLHRAAVWLLLLGLSITLLAFVVILFPPWTLLLEALSFLTRNYSSIGWESAGSGTMLILAYVALAISGYHGLHILLGKAEDPPSRIRKIARAHAVSLLLLSVHVAVSLVEAYNTIARARGLPSQYHGLVTVLHSVLPATLAFLVTLVPIAGHFREYVSVYVRNWQSAIVGIVCAFVAVFLSLSLMCWGTYYKLGSDLEPGKVAGLNNIVAISLGGKHTLALKDDGTVWAWGNNWHGQLGNGQTLGSRTPVRVEGLSDVTAISAGWTHSLALKRDGTVWAWGSNYHHQLGNLSARHRYLAQPRRVPGLDHVKDILALYDCSIAIKIDGTPWYWGDCWSLSMQPLPGRPEMLPDFEHVPSMRKLALPLAVAEDGSVWEWGRHEEPRRIEGLADVVEVFGYTSGLSLALHANGKVSVWGRQSVCSSFKDYETIKVPPTFVDELTGLRDFAQIHSTCVILGNNGSVQIWNAPPYAPLGRAEPIRGIDSIVSLPLPERAVALDTSWTHLAVLSEQGNVWEIGAGPEVNQQPRTADKPYYYDYDDEQQDPLLTRVFVPPVSVLYVAVLFGLWLYVFIRRKIAVPAK